MKIKLTKRVGQDKADEIKRQKQQSIEDYFDSIKPYANVIDSRILSDLERKQVQFSISCEGVRKIIHINNNQ